MGSHIQGSKEWLEMRRNHLGASDAPIIMGISPWKTPFQLWEEKLGMAAEQEETFAMKRGTEMEPEARKAFEDATNLEMFPQVVHHPQHKFMIASMDGLTLDGTAGVEIKCPGQKAHSIAKEGNVPEYYMPQLQHQLACLSLTMLYYYSFDGVEGVIIEIHRDEKYIAELIKREKEFWQCVIDKVPPKLTSRDYIDRESPRRSTIGTRLKDIDQTIKELEEERQKLKRELVEDSQGKSSKGGGITLTKTYSKGRIDYSSISELQKVDLEKYRKPGKEIWTMRLEGPNDK